MICSLLLGLLAGPLQTPAPAALPTTEFQAATPGLILRGSLPPGPVSELLADLSSEAGLHIGSAEQTPWPAWSDHEAWTRDQPWQHWLDCLADTETPAAFATTVSHLATLAHSQNRPEDTWSYLQRLPVADAARLLPTLVAGITVGATAAPAILEPILPPLPIYDAATWRELPPLREYRIEGLQIDQTTFTLSVQVPPEGVEVRFIHESGPSLELRVRIPVPANRTKRIEYVDWTRAEVEEGVNPVHTITLEPGSEDLVLWARCMPRRLPWPHVKSGASFPLDRDIELTTTATDPSLPRLRAMARATAKLLNTRVTVTTDGLGSEPSSGRAPLRIDLSPSEFREAKLVSILSQIERTSAQFR